MKRVLIGAIVLLVAGVATAAQEQVDVTGTWVMQVETSQGGGSPTFTFKQSGTKLEGTYEGMFGTAPISGTVKGNDAVWSFTVDVQGVQATIEYTGKVDKDEMKGTMRIGDLAEGTFTGSRKKG